MGLTTTDVAWEWKSKLASDQNLSHVSTPLVTIALVASIARFVVKPLAITPPCYHTPLLSHHLQAGRGSITLLSNRLYR